MIIFPFNSLGSGGLNATDRCSSTNIELYKLLLIRIEIQLCALMLIDL